MKSRFSVTNSTCIAVALAAASGACGPAPSPAPDPSGSTSAGLEVRGVQLDPTQFGARVDSPSLDGLRAPEMGPRSTPNLNFGLGVPDVSGFEGTLQELTELSPRLEFGQLEIESLILDFDSMVDRRVPISAEVIEIVGEIRPAKDLACSGLEAPQVELTAQSHIYVGGTIDASGDSCAGLDGGFVRVDAPEVQLEGRILAGSGCTAGALCRGSRGGRVEIYASDRLRLGPSRVIEVNGEEDGVVDVQSNDVRQRFEAPRGNRMLALSQTVQGTTRGAALDPDLAACAQSLGQPNRGVSFELEPLPAGHWIRVVAPDHAMPVVFDDGACFEPRREAVEPEASGWVVALEEPENVRIGLLFDREAESVDYTFQMDVTRR